MRSDKWRKTGVILVASCVSQQASAQATTDTVTEGNVVIVTGTRATSSTAAGIKRSKTGIVDAAVAEDMEKLPDTSATEALQRIPGIQINRSRGEGGSFSESNPLSVRGLIQVETTLNGREAFSAGSGRNLDLNDVPSGLLSSLTVYKTASPEHIEGGIGGSIDLRTHHPFDFSEPQAKVTAGSTYGDLVGKNKEHFSLLLSNRWGEIGNGEFGALLSLSSHERAWREDWKSVGTPTLRNDLMPGQSVLAPGGLTETTAEGTRKRENALLILQWRPSQRLELYAEGSFAQFRTLQNSYQFYTDKVTTFASGSVGLFPGTSDVQSITWTNPTFVTSGIARDTVDRTAQIALGSKWTAGNWSVNSDFSYTRSHNQLNSTAINLNGTAASISQNLSGTPSSAASGMTYNTAYVKLATRPFDGTQKTARLDAEYRVQGNFIESLATGIRLAERHATDKPGQVSYATATVPASNASGVVITNPIGNYFSGSIQDYLVGDPNLARNLDTLLASLGLSAAIPGSNPLGTWNIDETTRSAYAMANIRHGILDGNFGWRLVHTRDEVSGFQSVPSSSSVAPIDLQHRYTDLLPSLNLRQELARGLYLREAVSKTLTRPDFNQLSPSLTLNSVSHKGTANNPNLRPMRADNLDIALESYIDRNTALHLTGFAKKVDGFLMNVESTEIHDGQTYSISRPQSAASTTLSGVEIGYRQMYDFLPDWLRGLGLQANYTYIDSKDVDYSATQKMPLQNLSRHSYNLIGLYERGPVSARLAYNWRDKYATSIIKITDSYAVPTYMKAYGWLDAALTWRANSRLAFALEGLNLSRTRRSSYYGSETRPQSCWQNDRQLVASFTLSY
jgi:TonB-dependent receptor